MPCQWRCAEVLGSRIDKPATNYATYVSGMGRLRTHIDRVYHSYANSNSNSNSYSDADAHSHIYSYR